MLLRVFTFLYKTTIGEGILSILVDDFGIDAIKVIFDIRLWQFIIL